MMPPIDQGWAWVVAFGSGVNLFFVVGGLRSVGILFVEFVDRFEANTAMTAITVCLIAGGFAVLSPIANGIGMKVTMRKVVIVGGLVSSIAVFLGAFAMNIYYVIVIFGGLTGVGYGLMFGPCMVMVGSYFNKRRSLANGLAAAGGSLGQLCIPMALTYLLKTYGYTGTMILYSGAILHAIPAAMLFRPFTFWTCGKPFNPQAMQAQAQAKEQALAERQEAKMDQNSNMDRTENGGVDKDTHAIGGLDNGLSKSKLSLYASQNSLAFGQHQDAPPDAIDEDELAEEEEAAAAAAAAASPTCMQRVCGCCAMFDWALFKDWLFIVYVVGLSCGHGGYINVCMFLPAYAVENGVPKQMVAVLLGVVGASDLIGRILGGWFADLGIMKRNNIMCVCLAFTGLCGNLLPLMPTFPAFIVFAIILGMIGGVYVSLMVVVIIDFLGLAKLAPAFGLATMVMGLATIPVPIVLGIMKDVFGSFGPSIHICGVLMFLGGVSFGMAPLARKLNARKDKIDPRRLAQCTRETKI